MDTFNVIAGIASILSLLLAVFVTTKVYQISTSITKTVNIQNTERNGNTVEQKASGFGHKQVGGDYHGK